MNLIKQYAKKGIFFRVWIVYGDGTLICLYEGIETIEEAYMLCQYAIDHDVQYYDRNKTGYHGYIMMTVGHYRNIEQEQSYYKIAQRLAEKYKAE